MSHWLTNMASIKRLLLFFFCHLFVSSSREMQKYWQSHNSLCPQSLPVAARWTTAWGTSQTWLPVARGAFVTSGLPRQWWKNQTWRAPTERGTWPHGSAAKKKKKSNKKPACRRHVCHALPACFDSVWTVAPPPPPSRPWRFCPLRFVRTSFTGCLAFRALRIATLRFVHLTRVWPPSSAPLPPISLKLTAEAHKWYLDLAFIAFSRGVPPSFTETQGTNKCFQPRMLFVLHFFPLFHSFWVAFILCPSVAPSNGKIKHRKSSWARDAFQGEG